MLKVLIFTIVTSCTASTTHRYDTYEYYGNHRPVVPLLDNIFAFGNSNGRRPVQVYGPKLYDGEVKLSDSVYNHGPVINSEDIKRRVDTQYNQYPYQKRNEQDTSDKTAVSEPTQLYNKFESNLDGKYQNHNTDTYDMRDDKQQYQGIITHTNGTKLNESQGNGNITQINTQLDDVNDTVVINVQPITKNNDQRKRNQSSTEDSTNTTTSRNINANNKTNYIHLYVTKDKAIASNNRNVSASLSSIRFNSNSINNSNINNKTSKQNPTKTYNNRTIDTKTNSNINNRNMSNTIHNVITRDRNDYINTKYRTKTTQDNEVTPKTHEGRIDKDLNEDRWIWSNSDDKKVESTTLVDLDDRAAFSGNACPDGKIKVGNICITPD